MLALGYHLSTVQQSALVFDASSGQYCVAGVDGTARQPVLDKGFVLPTAGQGAGVGCNGKADALKRERVMRAMAQQRLQSEVHTLENALATGPTGPSALSPFLVMDTACYTSSLHTVKQLLASKRFVIVVPLAVIGTLDDLKKGNDKMNKAAREATRFLEQAFKQGDTRLRAQQRDESAEPPFEPDAGTPSDTLRILSCCMHFAYHICERVDMVTLLSKDRALRDMAQRAGILAEAINSFAGKTR